MNIRMFTYIINMSWRLFSMHDTLIFMNTVLKTLFDRRSLRLFSDKDISPEGREILLKAALAAPTAGNLMSYTIINVTDQQIKDRLVKTCDNQPMIAKAPMVLVFLADMQRLYDYFDYSEVPGLCKKMDTAYAVPKGGDLLLAANDAIIAAQNVVIAAESLGLGSCYIGDIIENIEEHRKIFSLPPWTFPVSMLILGYPKHKKPEKAVSRFPKDFIVHENSYHRFSHSDFQRMFRETEEQFRDRPYRDPAENLGQHIYLRKFSSDFMKEMRRSFRKGLETWNNGR